MSFEEKSLRMHDGWRDDHNSSTEPKVQVSQKGPICVQQEKSKIISLIIRTDEVGGI